MVNDGYDKILKSVNLEVNDPKLLRQAFTHRSYLNETKQKLESNERLEFLGDAILSFVVSYYLYTLRREDDEGLLTNLRAYIVKTKSLAEAAKNLDLGSYLLLSRGEDASGGRENPQLLANTYEALIGAIFLDQGLEATKKVISATLLPIFQKELTQGPPKDAKSELQEIVQNKTKQSPHYKILQTSGLDHAKQFVVGVFVKGENIGTGKGSNKQEAEEKAATEALKKLFKE